MHGKTRKYACIYAQKTAEICTEIMHFEIDAQGFISLVALFYHDHSQIFEGEILSSFA